MDPFSHGLWVAPSGKNDSGSMRYFFPVVEQTDISQPGWILFAGIAVPEEQAGDFRGLYKVRNGKDFPLFLNLSLPADPTAIVRCQTLFGRTFMKLDADVARYWLDPMPLFRIPSVNGILEGADLNEAMKVYQDGLVADPKNALLRLGVAASLEPKTDSETALRAYREALAADPNCFVTYHYIDAFFKRHGDAAGRISLWKEMARNYPEIYLPHFHLALALEEVQDFDGAIEAYRKVLELSPSDAETLKDLGRLFAGKDDVNAAIDAYQRASQIDPLDEQTENILSGLLARRKDH
jgi:tetratricopeptide (TPR) repeat protein